MKMSALLINPPSAGSYRSKIMVGDSLALSVVGGKLLSLDWSVDVKDCFLNQWSIEDLFEDMERGNLDTCQLIGITIMHVSLLPSVESIIMRLRKKYPYAYILLGGSAPTLDVAPFSSLPVDYIIQGDNLSYLDRVTEQIKMNARPEKPVVIHAEYGKEPLYRYAQVYRPDLEKSFRQDPIIIVEASRGCYGKCHFCTINYEYGSAWKPRDLNCLERELRQIRAAVPECKQIRFADANFLGGKKQDYDRVIQISELLKDFSFHFRIECRPNDINRDLFALLHRNGLCGVFIGVENGGGAILKMLRKGITSTQSLQAVTILQELRISYSFGFMMITPYTNDQGIHQNIRFLRQLKYGIRWKHFFSALLILREGTFKNTIPPVEDYEKNIGYHCTCDLCRKILRFHSLCLQNHLKTLELEHTIGITIERGKEARDSFYWCLDEYFSNMLLDTFEKLIIDLSSTRDSFESLRKLSQLYMRELNQALHILKDEIVSHGIPSGVLITMIKDKIFGDVNGKDI